MTEAPQFCGGEESRAYLEGSQFRSMRRAHAVHNHDGSSEGVTGLSMKDSFKEGPIKGISSRVCAFKRKSLVLFSIHVGLSTLDESIDFLRASRSAK